MILLLAFIHYRGILPLNMSNKKIKKILQTKLNLKPNKSMHAF